MWVDDENKRLWFLQWLCALECVQYSTPDWRTAQYNMGNTINITVQYRKNQQEPLGEEQQNATQLGEHGEWSWHIYIYNKFIHTLTQAAISIF